MLDLQALFYEGRRASDSAVQFVTRISALSSGALRQFPFRWKGPDHQSFSSLDSSSLVPRPFTFFFPMKFVFLILAASSGGVFRSPL